MTRERFPGAQFSRNKSSGACRAFRSSRLQRSVEPIIVDQARREYRVTQDAVGPLLTRAWGHFFLRITVSAASSPASSSLQSRDMPEQVRAANESQQRYNPAEIEPKWQARWDADAGAVRRRAGTSGQAEVLLLEMLPYPSGHCTWGTCATTPLAMRWRATCGCGATTCCTRWAGTPSGCRRRMPRSRTIRRRASGR